MMIKVVELIPSNKTEIIIGDVSISISNDRDNNKNIFRIIQNIMQINQTELNCKYHIDYPSSDYDDGEVFEMTEILIKEYNRILKVIRHYEYTLYIPLIVINQDDKNVEIIDDKITTNFHNIANEYKEYTFGRFDFKEDINKYGFLYKITLSRENKIHTYIGQKSFNRGTDWHIYKGSSKKVNELIENGYKCQYTVLGVFESEDELIKAETYQIRYEWANNSIQNINYAYNFEGRIVKRQWPSDNYPYRYKNKYRR